MGWEKSFLHGLKKGLHIYIELAIIIVAFFLLVTVLKHSSVFSLVETSLSPYLVYFGLSGASSIVLVTGFFASIYGAAGIIPALDLGWKEMTILGVMVTICHELITEGAILRKLKANYLRITALRIVLAFVAAFLLNLVL